VKQKSRRPDSEEEQNEDAADGQASMVFPLDHPNKKSKYIGQFAPEVSFFPCYIWIELFVNVEHF
jgi:hypothetical protein